MKEYQKLLLLVGVFLAAYFVPWGSPVLSRSVTEALLMVREYAREHVLFCLVPAFFIAGAIGTFISQASVLKYFGAAAGKLLSYSVAGVSGSVLAVCSCTVLPLFAGIYTRGAGLGPATAFLYSGPAINVLAIILTARVLGWKLGLARAIGAVLFAIITGLLMAFIFRREEAERQAGPIHLPDEAAPTRRLWQDALFLLTLVLILIFAAWARPAVEVIGWWQVIARPDYLELSAPGGLWAWMYAIKWPLTGAMLLVLAWLLWRWFTRQELKTWVDSTWGFTKQIMPLLFAGVLVAGFLLGRPGASALIPGEYIASLVGGNSIQANLLAAVSGALMYFATLTEVPILEGLIGAGMGQGPALSLLLAGPALSLPNMIVIGSVLGVKKTATFSAIIVVLSTLAGLIYGTIVG
ncbi:MAG: permease [Proteobacteria bacterium]|nr:permease [Pseudomonadota bacterium]MBU1741037.1 permease [Pseudomonadota bacterium]